MNRTLLTSFALVHIAAAGLALASCQNPQNTAKAVAIGELGLKVLEAKKVITPEEADLARQTGQILITPTTPPAAPITPSGK